MATTPPPCACGHIAYWHTKIIGSQMIGVPCWRDGCDCTEYDPDIRQIYQHPQRRIMATMIVPADQPAYVPVGGNELMLLGEFSRTVTIECACGTHAESFKLIADDVLNEDECDHLLDAHLRENGWLVDDSGEWCPECYTNGHHRGDS